MTIRKFGIDEIGKREDVKVWKCETCDDFHVKAGNVLLTFTREEFASFVDDTWSCFYEKEFSLSLAN
jgi:ribosomal protein L37AE/L43A